MDSDYDRKADWIGREIIPHEPSVRAWILSHWGRKTDVDDIIQEAYCRISALPSYAHIFNGRAYFFRTVQTVIVDVMRRPEQNNPHLASDTEWQNLVDDAPLPDRTVGARQELERVSGLFTRLSAQCRRVIELRRVHGLSQKETAHLMGVSEHVVENHMKRGLRDLLAELTTVEEECPSRKRKGRD